MNREKLNQALNHAIAENTGHYEKVMSCRIIAEAYAKEVEDSEWVSCKIETPPVSSSKENLFWAYSIKMKGIKLAYRNEYGTFDYKTGSGIQYSFWRLVSIPQPPIK